MTINVVQPSFAAGEISPAMFGRVDLAKYRVGAARLRNFFVDYRGGVATRFGTRYIQTSPTPGSGLPPRLIPFQFNNQQTYVLEFGQEYILFYKNGAPVISGGLAYSISTPYQLADVALLKFTQSADVMTITHPNYPPANLSRTGDTNWTLTYPNFLPTTLSPIISAVRNLLASGASTPQNTTYRYVVTAIDATSGQESLPSAPGQIATAAVMSQNGNEAIFIQWVGIPNAFEYNIYRQEEVPNSAPTPGSLYGLIGTVTNGNTFWDHNSEPDFSQTPPSAANPFANGLIDQIIVLAGGANYSDRTTVSISDPTGGNFQGTVNISGGVIQSVTVINPGFNYTAPVVSFNDPGSAAITSATVTSPGNNYTDIQYYVSDPTGYGAEILLTVSSGAITGASVIAGGKDYTAPILIITGGVGGAVTLGLGTPTVGSGASANANLQNPNNYPGCCCYFQQRLCFAGSNSQPETFWMTQPGNFNDMSFHTPSQAEDAITDTIASTQVNAIKSMVPMASGLVVLTTGGAWQILGATNVIGSAVSPSNIVAQPQAYNGASDVPPIVINYDILFVQSKGRIVRDLQYNFYFNVFTGTDLTAYSSHLFANRQIIQWAWAEEPFKIVWAIRDDGVLLSLTYLREQEVFAWARHDTNGTFCSVASVSEPAPNGGDLDAIYFVVRRWVGDQYYYFVERMADRDNIVANDALGVPAQVEQSWCLDAALALPMEAPAATLTVGTGASVVGLSGVGFESSVPVFGGGSVGQVIRGWGGKAVINAVQSNTFVTATIIAPFPVTPNDPTLTPLQIPSGSWTVAQPVGAVTGLSYIEGMTVGILADGNVLPQQVVKNGTITLPNGMTASQILVGLPFQCQLQSLPLDIGEPTIQGKRKKANAVTVRIKDGRGIKAGRTFETVVPFKEWVVTPMIGAPTIPGYPYLGGSLPLVTGDERVVLDPVYDVWGQICIQIDDPVPCTVLALIPEITMGDTP